ncbi:MAG: hypothetical protein F4213_15920 [Boseongicola sp. SB0677_bin_26]|nr:hypothetical protein [Boseongicola sp. SB0677_bin_26]
MIAMLMPAPNSKSLSDLRFGGSTTSSPTARPTPRNLLAQGMQRSAGPTGSISTSRVPGIERAAMPEWMVGMIDFSALWPATGARSRSGSAPDIGTGAPPALQQRPTAGLKSSMTQSPRSILHSIACQAGHLVFGPGMTTVAGSMSAFF